MAKKKKNSDESEEKVPDEISALSEIDKLIHEPVRLLIISYLFVVEETDMLFLRNQTKLEWGTLSHHINKLEEAGYVKVDKRFKGKKPQTLLNLTDKGRKAFEEYRKKMVQVLGDMT